MQLFVFMSLFFYMVINLESKPDKSKRYQIIFIVVKSILFFVLGFFLAWLFRDTYIIYIEDAYTRELWIVSMWLSLSILIDVVKQLLRLKYKGFFLKNRALIYAIYVCIQVVMTVLFYNTIGISEPLSHSQLFYPLIIIAITVFPGLHLELMIQWGEHEKDHLSPWINLLERAFILWCIYDREFYFLSLPVSLRIIFSLMPYANFKLSKQLYHLVMNFLIMSIIVLLIGLVDGMDFLKMWFNI